MARLSGLQRDVLSLYRQCMRAASRKPEESRENFRQYIRTEFRRNAQIDRKSYGTIEFFIRKGRRQLETYDAPGITNIF